MYHNSEFDWHLEDGTPLKLTQSTNYPWNGDIKVTVDPDHSADFTVYLRWPAWAASADVQVNGQPLQTNGSKRGSYIRISRTWNRGDFVTLSFPMPLIPMVANPRVADDYGRAAMQRGPLVYALEQIDQNGASLGDIFVRPSGPATTDVRRDLLGGVTTLKVSGQAAEKSLGEEPLYQPLTSAAARARRPIVLTFIPYYTIGNREPTPMEVWVPMARSDAPPNPASPMPSERRGEPK
jgi:DUF1680 family protein